MMIPLELHLSDVPNPDRITAVVQEEAGKLNRFCRRLTSCRVAIERPQRHQEVGNPYRVRIDMTVPHKHELVVKRDSSKGDMHDPLESVVKNAFNAAARRLEKLSEQQKGQVKSHLGLPEIGVVHKLFPERQYGFLKTLNTQEEVYFHRNSVLHEKFDRLAPGTGVRYTIEMGDKGPQATTVRVIETQGTPTEMPNHIKTRHPFLKLNV